MGYRLYPELAEPLQEAALLGLARLGFFEHVAFYGGTALRILHGLDRYSEDLDFTLLDASSPVALKTFLPGLERELESLGYSVVIEEKEKSIVTSVQSAFLKTSTQALILRLQPATPLQGILPEAKLRIKVELDTEPPLCLRGVVAMVREPVAFEIVTLPLPVLFAGKLHAALYRSWKSRVKGRDWYDVLWYLRKGIPVDLVTLNAYLAQNKDFPKQVIDTSQQLHDLLQEKLKRLSWAQVTEDVRPFVVNQQSLAALDYSGMMHALEWLKVQDDGATPLL